MIYFPLGVKLSATQKAQLLQEDKATGPSLTHTELPEELINNFIYMFPKPSKVRLTSIAPNETVTIEAQDSPDRRSVIVFPLSDNYAPFTAIEDGKALEVPQMNCYAFNTTLTRTIHNNGTRRVGLHLWYDMDIVQLFHIMTGQ
jgi:hypothetical protein